MENKNFNSTIEDLTISRTFATVGDLKKLINDMPDDLVILMENDQGGYTSLFFEFLEDDESETIEISKLGYCLQKNKLIK